MKPQSMRLSLRRMGASLRLSVMTAPWLSGTLWYALYFRCRDDLGFFLHKSDLA